MFCERIVVRGGGDLGTGVALRLYRAGFPVIVLESPQPLAVRRTVALAEAVYEGAVRVEEMPGRLTEVSALESVLESGAVPVLIDPEGQSLSSIGPYAVVDAIMAKRNLGTRLHMAPLVVALGPGFVAGVDADAVIETNRGPFLGRVIWQGAAEPNTGEPGQVAGKTGSRVLRAPDAGPIVTLADIGDIVEEGEIVATVNGRPVRSAFRGVLRGLVRNGIPVRAGMKVGDVDPRLDPSLCYLVSDKALAVAGGVLEAILMSLGTRVTGRRRNASRSDER